MPRYFALPAIRFTQCLAYGLSAMTFLLALAAALVLTAQPVSASWVDNYYYVKLPNGQRKQISPAKMHQVSVNHSNDNDMDIRTLASDQCLASPYQDPQPSDTAKVCRMFVSCTTTNWLAPYIPPGYDWSAVDSTLRVVDGNIRGSDDPQAKWVGVATGGIDIVGSDLPSKQTQSFQDSPPDPGYNGGKWKFQGTVTSENQFKRSDDTQTDDQIRDDFRQLRSRGMLHYPSYFKDFLDGLWKGGVAGGQPLWNNAPNRTAEIAYDDVGGNALHGTIEWTLEFPEQAPALACQSISASPTFSAVKRNDSVTFTCAPVEGATRYEYQVKAPDSDFYVPLDTLANGSSAAYVAESIGEHKAQCRACNATTCTTWGEPAACSGSFTIAAPPPEAPVCASTTVTPTSLQQGSSTNVTVSCQPVENTVNYKVTYPDPANPGQMTTTTTPSATTTIQVTTQPAGSYTISCVPCDGQGNCAELTNSCKKTLTITPKDAMACVSTSLSASNVDFGSTTPVTVTCGRVADAQSYKVVYPANVAAGTPATKLLQPGASGNPQTSFNVSNLAAGAYDVSCVPCTDDNGNNCLPVTNNCKAALTVKPEQLLGQVSCDDPNTPNVANDGKKAFRVDKLANGTEELVELKPNASVPRGSTVQFDVILKTNQQKAKNTVKLEDAFNSTMMQFVANSFNPAAYFGAVNGGKITMSVPAAEVAAKAKVEMSYRMVVQDLPQPATITNTVSVTDNGQGQAANSCTFALRRPAQGQAECESKTAYRMTSAGKKISLASGEGKNAASYVDPGSEFYYNITLVASEQTAGPVTVSDTLSDKLDFISASLDGATPVTDPSDDSFFREKKGNALKFVIPAFGRDSAPDKPSKRVITLKVKVKSTATPGDIDNKANVGEGDIFIPENGCSNKLRVPPNGVAQCENKVAQLLTSGQPGNILTEKTVVNTGAELLYTVNIAASSLTQGEVVVTDQLPARLELTDKGDFVYDAASGTLTATLPPFNGTKALKFKAKVKAGASAGELKNTATVRTKDRNGKFVGDDGGDACFIALSVPRYACNTSCTTNDQCKQVNNDYTCSASAGNKCRLEKNQAAENCQPVDYACNSKCETDANCQSVNSNYVCHDLGGSQGKACRLKDNREAANCLPPQATPTPAPAIGCNDKCATNADCSNPDHVCYDAGAGNMRCRLAANVTSDSCSLPAGATVAPRPAQPKQPVPPDELPQTGPENWSNWLKGGLVVIGVGALLLLLI